MAAPELNIEVKNLDAITRAMRHAPEVVEEQLARSLRDALLVLQQNVPPYPQALPDSKYRRTGSLGRSLGATESGSVFGSPDIAKVESRGMGQQHARFGTALEYAPKVIGRNQKPFFKFRGWWTIDTIARNSRTKITRIFNRGIARIAKRLEGKAG